MTSQPKLLFKKPKQISRYLKCPICFEIMQKAHYFSCGHTICGECSNQFSKPNNGRCPIGRCLIEHKSKIPTLTYDKTLNSIIDSIPVFCSNKNNGCKKDLNLGELRQHLEKCEFSEEKLPEWLKKVRGERVEVNVELDLADDYLIEEINKTNTCDLMTLIYQDKPELLKQALKKSFRKMKKKNDFPSYMKARNEENTEAKKYENDDDIEDFLDFFVENEDFEMEKFEEYQMRKSDKMPCKVEEKSPEEKRKEELKNSGYVVKTLNDKTVYFTPEFVKFIQEIIQDFQNFDIADEENKSFLEDMIMNYKLMGDKKVWIEE